MSNPMRKFIPIAAVVAFSLTLSGMAFSAGSIYKCVKDGKANYTANPRDSDGDCQETKIEEQNPADLARALEEKRLRQEEERKADEARLKEREIRAKELEAAAAARSARTQEQQLLLQRQSPQTPYPENIYPYWWGGGFRPIKPVPPAGGGQRPHSPPRWPSQAPTQSHPDSPGWGKAGR